MAARSRIADLILRAKLIDELQLRSALAHTEQWGGRLTRAVVDLRFVDEERLTEAIAAASKTPRVRLGALNKDQAALAKFDAAFCEQKGVFPVQLKDAGKTLVVAVADPTDLDTIDALGMKTRLRIIANVASEGEIERAILKFYKGIENPELHQRHNARGFGIGSDGSGSTAEGDEEEFKIVDMSGKTVMKSLADIVSPAEAARLQAAEAAPRPVLSAQFGSPAPQAPPPPPPASSAGDLLDEILSGAPPAGGFTPEELQRIEAVRVNQEKSSKILRALLELLLEKRRLSREELAARVR